MFELTGGEAHEVKGYDALMELCDARPEKLLGDKGYDADAIRDEAVAWPAWTDGSEQYVEFCDAIAVRAENVDRMQFQSKAGPLKLSQKPFWMRPSPRRTASSAEPRPPLGSTTSIVSPQNRRRPFRHRRGSGECSAAAGS